MIKTGKSEFGELFDEPLNFKQITWKVPNVLSLPDLVDYKVESPSFSFAGATWNLVMYPYGSTLDKSQGYIDLIIERKNSQFPEHDVIYKMCFKTRYGKEFEAYTFNGYIDELDNHCGVNHYIKKSKFIQMKNVLAPNRILTVVCEMRTGKINVKDINIQTELNVSFLKAPAIEFRQEPGSSTSTCKESSEVNKMPASTTTTSICKESAEVNQEPAPSTYTCKDCNCSSKDPMALPDNKIHQDFKELFLNQERCDVVIKVKGEEFRAHKVILTARSSVFASTFRNEMKEKATGMIEIEDCDPSSFADFLCFLYCGSVEKLTTENVFSLFITADKYDVQDLRLECLECIRKNLSVDTFCDTVSLALQYTEKELLELTIDFFSKHFREIIVTVKWQSFVVENPIQGNKIMVKSFVSNKK